MNSNITDDDLTKARKNWGDALVSISTAFEDQGVDAAIEIAGNIIDSLYGYKFDPVMFKPTLATGERTFRPTRDGCLSYFVGHNSDYPGDSGFGIKGWRSVSSETSNSLVYGDMALWMGWVILTDKNGNITKVDKSWGYKRDAEGVLRIVLHHSSLPYIQD